MSSLDLSISDLDALKRYLLQKHRMRGLSGVRLKHDALADRRNKKDPRAFCYVTEKSKIIRCTGEIEWIGANARVGILLHEILHLYLQALDGPESEVEVDEYAVTKLKETGYHYADLTYWSDSSGKFRSYKAKAIEQVSPKFIKLLEKYRG